MHPDQEFRVEPLVPSSQGELKLSTLEQTKVRAYTRNVSFFRTGHGASPQYVTNLLRQSLRCVLVELPALAGRIVLEDPDRGWVTCEVGPDEHAILHSCDYSQEGNASSKGIATFAQWENEGFPQSRLNEKLFQPPELSQPEANKRVLMAQATFIPGGMLLMTAFHHSAVDGGIRALVYKRWSHYCTLVTNQQPLMPRPPPHELLDRRRIFHGQAGPGISDKGTKYRPLTEQEIQSKNPMSRWMNQSRKSPGPVISTMFVISREKLDQLKAAARPHDTSGGKRWISTMDALVSFIWRVVTRSRLHSGRDFPTTKLGLAFSVRNRIEGVPADYTGITATILFISRAADQIAQDDLSHSLEATASVVRQEIVNFRPDDLFSELARVESFPDVRKATTDIQPHLGPDLIITDTRDASRSAACSWGSELGSSLAMRRFPGIIEGIVCINNELSDGSLEFEIPLEEPCMDELCRDEEFMSYVSVRCR